MNCVNGEALPESIINDERDIFTELLQHKDLKINWTNTAGESALHCAAGYSKLEAIRKLLGHQDIQVNMKDTSGNTPVMVAVRKGCRETLALLLADRRVDLFVVDAKGQRLEEVVGKGLLFMKQDDRRTIISMIMEEKVARENSNTESNGIERSIEENLSVMGQENKEKYRVKNDCEENDSIETYHDAEESLFQEIDTKNDMEEKVARENSNTESNGIERPIKENLSVMGQENKEKYRVQNDCEENDSIETYHDVDGSLFQEIDTKNDILDRKMKEVKHAETKNKEILNHEYENKMRKIKMENRQTQEDIEKEVEKEKNQLEMQYKLEKKELEKKYENKRIMIKQCLEEKLNILMENYMKSEEEEKKNYHQEQKLNEEKSKKTQNAIKKEKKELKDSLKQVKKSCNGDPEVVSSAKRDLECPICMNEMKPPTRIFQCRSGHPICGDCNERMRRTKCPTCNTQNIIGRAFALEQLARTLFQKE